MDESLRVQLPSRSAGNSTTSSSQQVSPTHSTASDPTTAGTSGVGTGNGSAKGASSLHLSLDPRSAQGPNGGANADLSTSPSGQPYVYPFQPPDPSPPPLGPPYLNQFSSMHQPSPEPFYNQYGPGGDQFSPDDLAFGLRGMNLSSGGGPGGNKPGLGGRKNSVPHSPAYSNDGYTGKGVDQGARGPPTRQNSNGFQPHFMSSPASPYLTHAEPYSPISPFGAPPPFYPNLPNGGLARRDSMSVLFFVLMLVQHSLTSRVV